MSIYPGGNTMRQGLHGHAMTRRAEVGYAKARRGKSRAVYSGKHLMGVFRWQHQLDRHDTAGLERLGVLRQGLQCSGMDLQPRIHFDASVHQTTKGKLMKTIAVQLTGKAPLLMHSDRFANPLDPLTKAHKELTSKRKKTDDDHTAIAKSEFIGGCYWKKGTGFYLPAQNLEACLIAAAKLQKLGVKFKQGVQVLEDELSFVGYEKKTPEQLWEDPDHRDCRGVKVGTAKIMRYRPILRKWSLNATIVVNEDVVNLSEVRKAIQDAGALIGLGDYRPRFGRFNVEFV